MRIRLFASILALVLFASDLQVVAAPSVTPRDQALRAIAEKHLPSQQAELVRVDDLSAWVPGAVLAFYEQPVAYETPSPQDRDLVAYFLAPRQDGSFQRVLVDKYGPEGANAEIASVALKATKGSTTPALAVRVIWQNTHGSLSQDCAYLKPELSAAPSRLKRLKDKRCTFEE